MALKNDKTTEDPRLDRVFQYDARSRSFPVGNILEIMEVTRKPRAYTWKVDRVLDQGSEGACVGFGWTHELLARPAVASIGDPQRFARDIIYKEAQKIDEWPGEDYEGTSVLAGAKVVQSRGAMKEYRWAFTLDDVILSLGYVGPVVLGLNWYAGMLNTDEDGYIKAMGSVVGGHCICAIGVSVKGRYIKLVNSWGKSWGIDGHCLLSFDDAERLLHEQGEACVPLLRQKLVA